MVFYALATLTVLAFTSQVQCEDSLPSTKFCPPWLGRRRCFASTSKRASRVLPVPMTAEDIRARIYFYSRLPSPNKTHEVLLYPEVHLNGAPFDRRIPTAILIHGFATNGSNAQWMRDLKDAYLKNLPANVFIVDWGNGASFLDYFMVAANTLVVGKEVGRLINSLQIDPKTVHLIGHSLGAHIASYAAHETFGPIGRITGLDAAQPLFEGYDEDVRLDPSDALFVDAIHTNARPFIPTLGFGVIERIGHVDFYMNSGVDQPGCLLPNLSKLPRAITSIFDLASFPVEVLRDLVVCHHSRAYEYFIEALASAGECTFWGTPRTLARVSTSALNTISQGALSYFTGSPADCNRSSCSPVGLSTPESPLRGSFEVVTAGSEPYCLKPRGGKYSLIDGVSSLFRRVGTASKSFTSFLG